MHTMDTSGLWIKISVTLTCLVFVFFGIVNTIIYHSRFKTNNSEIKEGYEHFIDFSEYTRGEVLSEILIRERLTHYYKNHDYTVHFSSSKGKMYYSHHSNLIQCELCNKEKGITKHEL